MEFEHTLIHGILIRRYKRFLADIKLDNGEIITAHTPNTGAMTGCCEPGSNVWLLDTGNPERKYQYSWELVQTANGIMTGINTLMANKLVMEGIQNNLISELEEYNSIKREVQYGSKRSRLDFLLKSTKLPDCYLEVKNVTLVDDGVAMFPDAVSKRGTRHLIELIDSVNNGNRSVIFFCIQRDDSREFRAANHIDADYTEMLFRAVNNGVQALAYDCRVSTQKIEINRPVPIKI